MAWDADVRKDLDAKAEYAALRSVERVTADEWEVYEKGIEKLRQFLSLPLVRSTTTLEERSPDGTAIIRHVTVEPLLGVTMSALAAVMSAVIRVGRQAAGMEEVERVTSLTPEAIANMSEAELVELHNTLAPIVERHRRPDLRIVRG